LNSAPRNLVQGNLIGTDYRGTETLGNFGSGVEVTESAANVIGGASVVAGFNNISGNHADGIRISGTDASGTVVEGNYIGTDATGKFRLPNGGDGVVLSAGAHDNVIGIPSLGNTIAFNGRSGVEVLDSGTINNGIRGNSIYLNHALGIDLNGDGVTPNDSGDPDEGPNHLQNFPVITAATAGAHTQVNGYLKTQPGIYTIDFYANLPTDSQGRYYLGTAFLLVGDSGVASFAVEVYSLTYHGELITAAATDVVHNNTSEFSAVVPATVRILSSASHASMTSAAVLGPVPVAPVGLSFQVLDRALDNISATGPLEKLWADLVPHPAGRRVHQPRTPSGS
jgi:hypothetical protein